MFLKRPHQDCLAFRTVCLRIQGLQKSDAAFVRGIHKKETARYVTQP